MHIPEWLFFFPFQASRSSDTQFQFPPICHLTSCLALANESRRLVSTGSVRVPCCWPSKQDIAVVAPYYANGSTKNTFHSRPFGLAALLLSTTAATHMSHLIGIACNLSQGKTVLRLPRVIRRWMPFRSHNQLWRYQSHTTWFPLKIPAPGAQACTHPLQYTTRLLIHTNYQS